jgi:2,3-bisphosphoglycerate-independent phosphoglycerate mutase
MMGGAAMRSSSMRMMSSSTTRRPVVLCILDGWGYSETLSNNAVTLANTPNFDNVYGRCSQLGQAAFLNACEKEVGLPTGQIGNSEVGHMNIGAGRVVYQVCLRVCDMF